ncbi:MAG TPA: fatty acid desaturase [Polyangiaceae bacterium]|nr:fatty acid desaturase [Polyangiaceae bacterium]
MLLRPISSYARELKSALPKQAFEPARSRLLWLPVHLAVIALGMVALSAGWLPWLLAPLVSLAIGVSFAGLTFLAHETLHGAVVRGRGLRRLVGTIGFFPFMVSPRLWIAWHNRVHHGNANRPDVDPDAYPTLAAYRKSWTLRMVTDHLGPGREKPAGLLSLLIGFSVQSAHVLVERRHYLSPRDQRWALVESGLAATFWLALALTIGFLPFLFAFVLPLLVANAMVMGFILTNHSLSPHTEINDPLVNSLSVTLPRALDFLTLSFGYHVEHHVFPWMSSRHAPAVRELLRARFPERYQSMPLWRALLTLHRTGRVYKDETTLLDAPTGKEWRTLLPREEHETQNRSAA